METKGLTICLVGVCVMAVAGVASADTFGTGGNAFTIDFVPISGSLNPASGYGIVNNDYRMGKFEITNNQWNKFKTAYGTVTGSLPSAYDDQSPYWPGANVPNNDVSCYEAVQFVNWLNTINNYQPAYKFTGTQGTNNYTLSVWESGDSGYNASNPFRNSKAFYFLPTENEWIKAAYWNGVNLQTYATKAGQTLFQGNGSNGGWNYYGTIGPWSVGSGSEELNGTFDMMGNVWEWMESPYYTGEKSSNASRGIRGGSWGTYICDFSSSKRYGLFPYVENDGIGFRVASVPEPSSLILLFLCGLALRSRGK